VRGLKGPLARPLIHNTSGRFKERSPVLLDRIEKVVHLAENILLFISGVLFMGLMFLGAGDVLGRYLLNSPIRGTLEYSEILMGGIVLLSWAYTQRNKGHVNVELLISHYPPRMKAAVNFVMLLLSLLLFAAIAKQSTVIALRCWQEHRVIPTLDLPTAPFHSIVPIGAAMLCIELIIQMIRLIPSIRKG
jgi:TRAP-type C4-dicarboxylate transport system permease small subunit